MNWLDEQYNINRALNDICIELTGKDLSHERPREITHRIGEIYNERFPDGADNYTGKTKPAID